MTTSTNDNSSDEEDEEDTLRAEETMVLKSMYDEHELIFAHQQKYEFELKLTVDDIPTNMKVSLPKSYPNTHSDCNFISLQIPALNNAGYSMLMKALKEEIASLDDDDNPMKVLHAIEWLKDNLGLFVNRQKEEEKNKQANISSANDSNSDNNKQQGSEDNILCNNGFMREWCSFVSLYKDSYISGPNRFEVLDTLANHRGLSITGMAIAGKPGGLVVEGREENVIRFMTSMRTEFFETLNPRGRKLTTRLQERYPLDHEVERYEAAKAKQNLVEDVHQKERREKECNNNKQKLKQNKILEHVRLKAWEESDRDIVKSFEENRKRVIDQEERIKLVEAGPPTVESVATSDVYEVLTQEVTEDDINARRKFKDFSILTGGNNSGYETAYQDAGVLLTEMDMKHGFDAMFAYRFS